MLAYNTTLLQRVVGRDVVDSVAFTFHNYFSAFISDGIIFKGVFLLKNLGSIFFVRGV